MRLYGKAFVPIQMDLRLKARICVAYSMEIEKNCLLIQY